MLIFNLNVFQEELRSTGSDDFVEVSIFFPSPKNLMDKRYNDYCFLNNLRSNFLIESLSCLFLALSIFQVFVSSICTPSTFWVQVRSTGKSF
jgi:hypothetical protein